MVAGCYRAQQLKDKNQVQESRLHLSVNAQGAPGLGVKLMKFGDARLC